MTDISRPRDLSRSHTSPSPFHRAHHSLDPTTSRIPSPRSNYGARSRSSVGKTRTLRGAFEAAYIGPHAKMAEDQTSSVPQTPSPHGTKPRIDFSLPSPASDMSIPPAELNETYQQIVESENLAFSIGFDDYDRPPSMNLSDVNVLPRLSPTPSTARNGSPKLEQQTTGSDNNTEERASVGSNDSRRKRFSNPALDEQRLKRVTALTSPVFSKAKVGEQATLSVDNLRQLDQEQRSEENQEPPLNVPRTWGSRARTHRDWLNSLTKQNGHTPREQEPRRSHERDLNTDIEFAEHSLQASHIPPVRSTLNHSRRESSASWPRNEDSTRVEMGDGHPIPNSPVVIYRSTSLEERPRTDSRELLRKLARTESPSQSDTAELAAKTAFKQLPVNRMLDKTPIVTGAWIDTPVTERVVDNTEDISKEIESPSKPKSSTSASINPIITTVTEKKIGDKASSALQASALNEKKTKSNGKEGVQEKKESVKRAIRPNLPKSALEAVLREVNSNEDSLIVGDETIASLEELVRDESPTTELKEEGEITGPWEKTTAAKDKTADSVRDEDTSEMAIMDRLGNKLRSVRYRIRDTKKEIGGLEKRIFGKSSKPTTATTATKVITKMTGPGTDIHIVEREAKIYLAVPIPRLWRENSISGRLELTRLGWFLGIFLMWFIMENIMADYYAHPTVAMVCDRNCLMPDAPEFPFVLPTMLWRWSHLGTILSPIFTILVACYRLIAQILGIWDGYVDDVPISVTRPTGTLEPSSWPWPFGGHGVFINKNPIVPVAKVSPPSETDHLPPDINMQNQYQRQQHHHPSQFSAEDDDLSYSMEEDEVL